MYIYIYIYIYTNSRRSPFITVCVPRLWDSLFFSGARGVRVVVGWGNGSAAVGFCVRPSLTFVLRGRAGPEVREFEHMFLASRQRGFRS